jgi:signal transduction histidine kinase
MDRARRRAWNRPALAFTRGHTLFSRRKGGSGIGLTVAREIVERHGGRTQIESAPGSGTLVSIVLPSVLRA